MKWRLAHRAHATARLLADRHYSRQKPGTKQFVPPGRCLVFRIGTLPQGQEPWSGGAYWITSWPFAEYVRHAWAGAWICSAFRNEGAGLSSELIREVIAATRFVAGGKEGWDFGRLPDLGMVTFVDAAKTRRGRSKKSEPGKCFLDAGFRNVGATKGGLVALQLLPHEMPEPAPPYGHQPHLIA